MWYNLGINMVERVFEGTPELRGPATTPKAAYMNIAFALERAIGDIGRVLSKKTGVEIVASTPEELFAAVSVLRFVGTSVEDLTVDQAKAVLQKEAVRKHRQIVINSN